MSTKCRTCGQDLPVPDMAPGQIWKNADGDLRLVVHRDGDGMNGMYSMVSLCSLTTTGYGPCSTMYTYVCESIEDLVRLKGGTL